MTVMKLNYDNIRKMRMYRMRRLIELNAPSCVIAQAALLLIRSEASPTSSRYAAAWWCVKNLIFDDWIVSTSLFFQRIVWRLRGSDPRHEVFGEDSQDAQAEIQALKEEVLHAPDKDR